MSIRKIVAVGSVAACLAVSASALQVQSGYPGSGYGPYQTGSGGEFTLTVVDGTLDLSGYFSAAGGQGTSGVNPYDMDSFQTFCVEDTERIYPYNATMNAVVAENAMYGSVGPAGDPISVGTGWLYYQFASGLWESGTPGYDYSNPGRSGNSASSAYKLQQAVWFLENEIDSAPGNIYVAAATDEFGSLAKARENGGKEYGVWALNLTTLRGARRQDQLYYDGTHRVPDGGMTLALVGFALVGLAGLSRRIL